MPIIQWYPRFMADITYQFVMQKFHIHTIAIEPSKIPTMNQINIQRIYATKFLLQNDAMWNKGLVHCEIWAKVLLLLGASEAHYSNVKLSAKASQITGVLIVCSTVCSGAVQRKHQSPASLAFFRGIHRWPVDSPQKGSVTRKMFPFDDVIMIREKNTVEPLQNHTKTRWNSVHNIGVYFIRYIKMSFWRNISQSATDMHLGKTIWKSHKHNPH